MKEQAKFTASYQEEEYSQVDVRSREHLQKPESVQGLIRKSRKVHVTNAVREDSTGSHTTDSRIIRIVS